MNYTHLRLDSLPLDSSRALTIAADTYNEKESYCYYLSLKLNNLVKEFSNESFEKVLKIDKKSQYKFIEKYIKDNNSILNNIENFFFYLENKLLLYSSYNDLLLKNRVEIFFILLKEFFLFLHYLSLFSQFLAEKDHQFTQLIEISMKRNSLIINNYTKIKERCKTYYEKSSLLFLCQYEGLFNYFLLHSISVHLQLAFLKNKRVFKSDINDDFSHSLISENVSTSSYSLFPSLFSLTSSISNDYFENNYKRLKSHTLTVDSLSEEFRLKNNHFDILENNTTNLSPCSPSSLSTSSPSTSSPNPSSPILSNFYDYDTSLRLLKEGNCGVKIISSYLISYMEMIKIIFSHIFNCLPSSTEPNLLQIPTLNFVKELSDNYLNNLFLNTIDTIINALFYSISSYNDKSNFFLMKKNIMSIKYKNNHEVLKFYMTKFSSVEMEEELDRIKTKKKKSSPIYTSLTEDEEMDEEIRINFDGINKIYRILNNLLEYFLQEKNNTKNIFYDQSISIKKTNILLKMLLNNLMIDDNSNISPDCLDIELTSFHSSHSPNITIHRYSLSNSTLDIDEEIYKKKDEDSISPFDVLGKIEKDLWLRLTTSRKKKKNIVKKLMFQIKKTANSFNCQNKVHHNLKINFNSL